MSRTGQVPHVIAVTVASAGTAQRIVTDPDDIHRFMYSGYMCPAFYNGSSAVYVGDANVSNALYTDRLVGNEAGRLTFKGDAVASARENAFNYLDLYNTWVDADANGDELFVTIFEVQS